MPRTSARSAGLGDDAVIEAAVAAIGAIRKAKSQARLPMKNPVPLLILTAGQQRLDALLAAGPDVQVGRPCGRHRGALGSRG